MRRPLAFSRPRIQRNLPLRLPSPKQEVEPVNISVGATLAFDSVPSPGVGFGFRQADLIGRLMETNYLFGNNGSNTLVFLLYSPKSGFSAIFQLPFRIRRVYNPK